MRLLHVHTVQRNKPSDIKRYRGIKWFEFSVGSPFTHKDMIIKTSVMCSEWHYTTQQWTATLRHDNSTYGLLLYFQLPILPHHAILKKIVWYPSTTNHDKSHVYNHWAVCSVGKSFVMVARDNTQFFQENTLKHWGQLWSHIFVIHRK